MSVDMTRSFAFTFCTTGGGTAIAVQKRGSGVKNGTESFSAGPETEYRFQTGLETWGDNNIGGDIKVDNKVDNNAGGDNKVDNKVDNNVWDDTVNETVKHPQIRLRTITPYNTRTRPVQHPYKTRRCRLGEVMRGGALKHGPLTNSLKEKVRETFVAVRDFVAPKYSMGGIGI